MTAALLLVAAAATSGAGLAQHEGHAMPAAQEAPKPADILEWLKPTPPVLPPPAAALSGPAHAADAVFGAEAMARARATLTGEHGDIRVTKFLVDQAEARIGKGRDGYFLNGEAWNGGDIDRLWFKTEIEGDRGRRPDQAELQALWSHAIDPWFQVQTGVRHDFNRGADRTHLAVGVQGLAPYWFELDGALFLSTKGELTARGEAEYDLRLTQRLILQPRLEVNLSAQDIPELGIGSGLVAADLGLRLRYHFDQRFAPYLGIGYERAFGDTRRARRAAGDGGAGVQALVGVRLWF